MRGRGCFHTPGFGFLRVVVSSACVGVEVVEAEAGGELEAAVGEMADELLAEATAVEEAGENGASGSARRFDLLCMRTGFISTASERSSELLALTSFRVSSRSADEPRFS